MTIVTGDGEVFTDDCRFEPTTRIEDIGLKGGFEAVDAEIRRIRRENPKYNTDMLLKYAIIDSKDPLFEKVKNYEALVVLKVIRTLNRSEEVPKKGRLWNIEEQKVRDYIVSNFERVFFLPIDARINEYRSSHDRWAVSGKEKAFSSHKKDFFRAVKLEDLSTEERKGIYFFRDMIKDQEIHYHFFVGSLLNLLELKSKGEDFKKLGVHGISEGVDKDLFLTLLEYKSDWPKDSVIEAL